MTLIEEGLLRMLEKSPGLQMKFADPAIAFESMRLYRAAGKLVMYDGYAIMFDLGCPWYTDKLYLIEELIMRVRPCTVPVQAAVAHLHTLGQQFGCVMVSAGDTQIGMMAPIYEQEGYRILGVQLVKEIVYDGMGTKSQGR